MSIKLVERARAKARREGLVDEDFAATILYVSRTTLWRIVKGTRALKHHELARIRAYLSRP